MKVAAARDDVAVSATNPDADASFTCVGGEDRRHVATPPSLHHRHIATRHSPNHHPRQTFISVDAALISTASPSVDAALIDAASADAASFVDAALIDAASADAASFVDAASTASVASEDSFSSCDGQSDGYLLPSEVARLVLGYLESCGAKNSHRAFLLESKDLEEFRRVSGSFEEAEFNDVPGPGKSKVKNYG